MADIDTLVREYQQAERVQEGTALAVLNLHRDCDIKSNTISIVFPFGPALVIYLVRTEDITDGWITRLTREEFPHIAIQWLPTHQEWGVFFRKKDSKIQPKGYISLESALQDGRVTLGSQLMGANRPSLSAMAMGSACTLIPDLPQMRLWKKTHASRPQTEEDALWVLTPSEEHLRMAAQGLK